MPYRFYLNLRKKKEAYNSLFASSITDKISLNEAAVPHTMGIQSYGFCQKYRFCTTPHLRFSIKFHRTSCFHGNILRTLVFFKVAYSKWTYFSPLYGKNTLPTVINQDRNYTFPGGEWMRGSNGSLLTIRSFPQQGHNRGSIPLRRVVEYDGLNEVNPSAQWFYWVRFASPNLQNWKF